MSAGVDLNYFQFNLRKIVLQIWGMQGVLGDLQTLQTPVRTGF